GAAGRAAPVAETAGPAGRRAAVLFAQARLRRRAAGDLPGGSLEGRKGRFGPRRRPGAGAATVAVRRRRPARPRASPPLPPRPRPPARAADEALAAGAEAGGLAPAADGLPHHRRRGGAPTHA